MIMIPAHRLKATTSSWTETETSVSFFETKNSMSAPVPGPDVAGVAGVLGAAGSVMTRVSV